MAVGIAHIDARTHTASPEEWTRWSHIGAETTRGDQLVEVDLVDHQGDVVDVGAVDHAELEIDDRVGGDSHRHERGFAPPPLLEPDHVKTEQVAVPRDRPLHVRHPQHHMIELSNAHGPSLAPPRAAAAPMCS